MAFLLPFFLAGLAALAVPVAIHLIQREKKEIIAFPSLMFVRRVPYESVRRRKIRHWALLALRLAALLLIVLAFARPFLRGSVAAVAGGAREVVILLDRSYSMGYGDRWSRAQTAARSVLDALGAGDRASIVLFGTSAEIAAQSLDDRARLTAAIAAATPGAEATRYAPALKAAGTILVESTRPRKDVVLISDFQKLAWQPTDDQRLPAGTAFTPVSVADVETSNLAVVPVSVTRARFEGQERATITAGVTNRGSQAVKGATLSLELDGRAAETVQVDVAPQASASATFPPVTLTPVGVRAVVRLAKDSLDADNAFYAVLTPAAPVPVLLVGGGGRGADDTYLRRALSIGQAPRFDVSATTLDSLTDEALGRTRVLVLHDVALGDAAVARVLAFAERGGGVLVVAGPRASWPQSAAMPGALGDAVDRARGDVGRLSGIEYGHAVFAPFKAPRSGDFSSVRVYGYRRVTPAQGARVLARYDDGQPALVERTTGAGRMLLWSSTVDASWSDIAVKPVFLPFVHQLVRTLAAFEDRPAWRTVGQVAVPETPPVKGQARVAVDPLGRRVALDASKREAFEITAPGFYEVRAAGQDAGTATAIAANVDLAESDLASVDPATVAAGATGSGQAGQATAASAAPPRDEVTEQSQRLWWYLLFAGMLLLVGESLLAGRMSRSPVER